MKHRHTIPPKLAQKILLRFLRDDLAEEVQGDLEENFFATLKNRSRFRAKLNYWYQVLNYARPFAIRKWNFHFNHYAMLRNYFTIGWRSMSKQKIYSAIKVGGFALGIASCLLIALFIRNELRYDQHYPKGDRIFRVVDQATIKGTTYRGVHFSAPFASVLMQDYPEIEQVARINPVAIFGAGSNDIRRDDQAENTYEEGFVWADPAILQMFDVRFVYGDAKTALSEPNSMVITKSKADKYFPNENPLGKLMIVSNNEAAPFKIGGVIEDLPANSHFQYEFFMTLAGKEFGQGEQTNWLQTNYPTYVLLRQGADPVALAEKFQSMGEKYLLPPLLDMGYPDAKVIMKTLRYHLQPISDIYLNQLNVQDDLNHGDIRFVWMSGAVALFILVIACINFINLSTAKSANRAREVGLRKAIGSPRSNLINQFLTESLLYSFFSFFLGLGLAWLLMPFFNTLVGKDLAFPWNDWWLVPGMVGCAIAIGIFAGIYPSFYLSSFKPVNVLKGNIARGSRNARTRSMLVVFQFTTSIILIIGTFIIYRQMEHILNAKIGYEKDQVILLQGTGLLGDKVNTFRNELLTIRDVSSASVSDYLPIRGTSRNGNTFDNAETVASEAEAGQFWVVDADYIKTLGMTIVEGRDFSVRTRADSNAVIVNQAMVKALGYKDPIGKKINNGKDWTIIGVVKDFNYETLKENVEPLCMVLGNSPSMMAVKVNTQDMASVIQSITTAWKQFAPKQPLRYTFMDETYARMHEDVSRMGRIFTSFAMLAIVVACLGLFGLSSFMVEQRSKEIGIRLVLGASVNNIFRLLTQNFVKLVLISFVIGAPVAWYIMDKWLEDYVYKTGITWDIFLMAGLITLLIALLTISYQAIRAGMVKAVDSLKAE